MSRLIWIYAVIKSLILAPVAAKELNSIDPYDKEPSRRLKVSSQQDQYLHCLPFLIIYD